MTRFPRATSSGALALILLLAAAGVAQEEDRPAVELKIPAGAAPVLDGKLAAGEWDAAARFAITSGEEKLGDGFVRRARRQLCFAVRCDLEELGLGLRFNFRDPGTKAGVQVLVVPLAPPRSPVVVFREPADGTPERVSAVGCGVAFDMSPERGFTLELRIPLDLIGIGRDTRGHKFNVEIWALQQEQPLAAFPLEGGVALGEALLTPAGDWGADVPAGEAPVAANEAIALLEAIETEGLEKPDGTLAQRDTLFAYMGWRDGRRRDAPLAQTQSRLEKALAAHPDYASLSAALVWAHFGRGDQDAAYATHKALGERYPVLGRDPRYVLLGSQLLRGLGRHAEAVALLEAHPYLLRDPVVEEELATLKTLRRALELEEQARAAEAKRDDLPRVRLHVVKADGSARGTILIELFEDDAPNAVANYVSLVESGFYEGTRFHWVEGGRRVIGGDPNSKDDDPANDGHGGPGYRIESEPSRRLNLRHTVSFSDEREARRSEGSTFMIQLEPFPTLDGINSVIGRVIDGFDTLRAIEYYDVVAKAEVVRKRQHEYAPVKR